MDAGGCNVEGFYMLFQGPTLIEETMLEWPKVEKVKKEWSGWISKGWSSWQGEIHGTFLSSSSTI